MQEKRAQPLIEDQAISREEYDQRTTNLTQGNADVRAAEAAVATARLNLDFTQVRSPIAGRAGRALLTVGNLAQADESVLTTVVSQDPVYVYFEPTSKPTCATRNWRARANARLGESGARRPRQRDRLSAYGHGGLRRQPGRSDDRHDPRARRAAQSRPRVHPGPVCARAASGQRRIPGDPDRRQGGADRPGPQVRLRARTRRTRRKRKDIVLGRMVEACASSSPASTPDDKIIVAGLQKIFLSRHAGRSRTRFRWRAPTAAAARTR